jgi:ribonuclease HI
VQQVRQLSQLHDITVQTVRGHSGHVLNERCDRLATAAAEQFRCNRDQSQVLVGGANVPGC